MVHSNQNDMNVILCCLPFVVSAHFTDCRDDLMQYCIYNIVCEMHTRLPVLFEKPNAKYMWFQ